MRSNPLEQTNAAADRNPWVIPSLIIFLVAANSFTAWFIGQEKYIYHWDLLNYWSKYAYLTENFLPAPVDTLRTVYYSIREDNYNYLSALFLMPFGLLFGVSRLAYILAIVNVFAFPVAALFMILHRKASELMGYHSKYLPLICVGTILISPNFWHPLFYGYLDAGGWILINIVLWTYLKRPYAEQRLPDFVLVAVLIAGLALFRRWYTIWGLAFYATLAIEAVLIGPFLNRQFDLKSIAKVLLMIFLQASITAGIFFAAAPVFALRILTTNYVDLNSAYKNTANLFESLLLVLGPLGLVFLSLFLLGAVSAVLHPRTRRFALFLLVQWPLLFWLFARNQDFDCHQLYLLLQAVLLFAMLGITRLVVKPAKFKPLVMAGLISILVLNFGAAFKVKGAWITKALPGVLTNVRHPPLVRHDMSEIERLLKTLGELLTDPGDRIYVLHSSYDLNQNVLDSAYLSLGPQYKETSKRIVRTRNVDKRDGFPEELLTAKYVILGYPMHWAVNEKDQRVVGVPAELIRTRQGIGAAFEKLPYEFDLADDVKVTIYRKVRPFSNAALDDLSDRLRAYYPDRKNIYEIPVKLRGL